MQRKSTKPWIILIVAPFVALVILAIAQAASRFVLTATGDDSNITVNLINIVSIIIGSVAMLAMLGLPLWIVMLVITANNNSKLPSQPPSNLGQSAVPVVQPSTTQTTTTQQATETKSPTNQQPPVTNQQ